MGGIAEMPDSAFGAEENTESDQDAVVPDDSDTDSASSGDELKDEVQAEAKAYVGEEEETEEVESSEDEEKEKPIEPKKNSRAEQRIRSLIKTNKEAEARLQEFGSREGQIRQQLEQYAWRSQQQQSELMKQNAVLMRELELLKQQSSAKEEENLDPAERLVRRARQEALRDAETKIGGEVKQVKQQYERLLQDMKDREEEAARNQRLAGYAQTTDMVATKLLQGIEPEVVESLREDVKTQILNFAAAMGMTDIDAAAREWDRVAHKYVLSKAKLRSKLNGEKAQKAAGIPQATSSNIPSKGRGRITHNKAVKSGFKDALDAMISSSFGTRS